MSDMPLPIFVTFGLSWGSRKFFTPLTSLLCSLSETCYRNVVTNKVTSLDVQSNFVCDHLFRTCLPEPPLMW